MNLTTEQQEIITETITNKNGEYSVSAVAGSGKSFTIFKSIDYIKEHEPNAKILYLVFNKANQLDAERKLAKYNTWLYKVDVKTAHSFAYTKWLSAFGPFKAIERFDWQLIYPIICDVRNPDIRWSKRASFDWLLDKYCASKLPMKAFCSFMYEHFEDDYNGPDPAKEIEIINFRGKKEPKFGIQVNNYAYISKAHIHYFPEIYDAHVNAKEFTHGMYLKHAAYSNKTGGSSYDYVFFDEAQDSNYFMLRLLEKQDIKKIYFVGDERQSIYKFGGSTENVFLTHEFNKSYTLSKSFRFGKQIADLANKILHLNSSHTIIGTKQEHEMNENATTRLYRTNAKLFEDAMTLAYDAKQAGVRLKIDLLKASLDDSTYVELLSFIGIYYHYCKPYLYQEYKSYLPDTVPPLANFEKRCKELGFLTAYNEQYDYLSDDIHGIFKYVKDEEDFLGKYIALKNALKETNPEYTLTMITMHRAKGMEWDNVLIAEPTKLYYEDRNGTYRRNSDYMQELNLAYVAVTRGRISVNAEILREELCKENEKFEIIPMKVGEREEQWEQKQHMICSGNAVTN